MVWSSAGGVNEQNLEKIDSGFLRINASIAIKSSDALALTAKKHYVEQWP